MTAAAGVGRVRASLARIAGHARVSKGAISSYFDGKDDLVGRIVAEIYADIWGLSSARDRLRVCIAAALED
ncbi:hypothetical protein GCM10009799_45660 [Nocardiopsis rhodophaea]|uniref:HTH tetR-type domain-containing protein n=2 Tax=Nocardiopsis rhodophaea TaxID=280238 RepID=A0ABN2TKK1_9ACTN